MCQFLWERERERERYWLIDWSFVLKGKTGEQSFNLALWVHILCKLCYSGKMCYYVIVEKCVTSNYVFHVFISISWWVVSLEVYSGWCWFSSADTGQRTECDTTGDSSGGRHQEFWGSDRLVLCVVSLTMWTWHVVACTHVCAFTHFPFLSPPPPSPPPPKSPFLSPPPSPTPPSPFLSCV